MFMALKGYSFFFVFFFFFFFFVFRNYLSKKRINKGGLESICFMTMSLLADARMLRLSWRLKTYFTNQTRVCATIVFISKS